MVFEDNCIVTKENEGSKTCQYTDFVPDLESDSVFTYDSLCTDQFVLLHLFRHSTISFIHSTWTSDSRFTSDHQNFTKREVSKKWFSDIPYKFVVILCVFLLTNVITFIIVTIREESCRREISVRRDFSFQWLVDGS